MAQDHSNKNLQKAVLQDKDLGSTSFSGSDLRGADFTGSNLMGADLSNVKTGIRPIYVVAIFIIALAISLVSGYIAAKASLTIKGMLDDESGKIRLAGIISLVIVAFSFLYALRRGGNKTILHVIIPVIIAMAIIAAVFRWSGIGTGIGAFYIAFTVVFVVVMIYIGTVARAAAGSLSNILFIIVAIAGGIFGKSITGGIGPVILAVVCALLSKRALNNVKHFALLRRVIFFMTTRFGTSFRNTNLTNADFSNSVLRNTDFSGADLTGTKWSNSTKLNCKINDEIVTDKKKKHG